MADEEDTGDFLEREKKNDPLEKITKYMEEDLRLRKQQAEIHPGPFAIGEAPVRQIITLNVRKIGNGWIMAIAPEGHHGGYGDETYFPTAEELVKGVAATVEAFSKGLQAI